MNARYQFRITSELDALERLQAGTAGRHGRHSPLDALLRAVRAGAFRGEF